MHSKRLEERERTVDVMLLERGRVASSFVSWKSKNWGVRSVWAGLEELNAGEGY